VRIDDTPEVLSKRLANYRTQTEPLIHYYSERRKLLTVDGMMTIEHVTREINRILSAIGAVELKATTAKQAKASARKAGKPAAKKPAKTAKKAAKAAPKAAKAASKGGKTVKKATKKTAKKAGKKAAKKTAKKAVKKVTKKRAKR